MLVQSHRYIDRVFSPSLLMTSCLGNIQWRELQLTLFLAATHFLECFMTNTSSLTTYFLFFSLFQSTSFESSLLFTPYELEIESNFERAPLRVSGRSRAGVLVSFPIRSIKCFELVLGFNLAPFRKNVVHYSPRPRCLGPQKSLSHEVCNQFLQYPIRK